MLVKRGYRVELDLDNGQITLAKKHCGAARWAYNWGLTRKQEAYQAGLPTPYAKDLHRELNALKQTEVPWMHKATSALVARTKPDSERPMCIVLEDLNITGMLKNRKLSRAIADVGMYEFRRQVQYKAFSAGEQVVLANRWEPSSKTCSDCGWHNEALTLADRVFVCSDCGSVKDRDYNAAQNLAKLAEL